MEKEPHSYINYTDSTEYDRRLYREDIAASIAHTRMLAKQAIITEKEAEAILSGLDSILKEIEDKSFPWRQELEDIHMNIETRLHELVGNVAGRLHTARSRNDQVVTDLRLYVKKTITNTIDHIKSLQMALLKQAENNASVVMPGYTHLQRAQPVLLSHHILAYFEMLKRDSMRFKEAYTRADVLPLGSGALAGSPYPLDRSFTADQLGFGQISNNSMDAVSDRDFAVDYVYAAAMTMMHLSRLAEELILWCSKEFNFVAFTDEFTTGSSIMPQKRNPDFAELARGKTGRVYGDLVTILTILKGLPLTYNRDLQEDKECLFDAIDTLSSTLHVLTGAVSTVQFNSDQMRKAVEGDGYSLATDLADYLVLKGLPFRQAHGIIAQLTQFAHGKGQGFEGLALEEYQRFSPLFENDVFKITVLSSLNARNVKGGTAPRQVEAELKEARKWLESSQ